MVSERVVVRASMPEGLSSRREDLSAREALLEVLAVPSRAAEEEGASSAVLGKS